MRVTDLIDSDYEQVSLFDEADEKLCIDIGNRIQTLINEFSKLGFEQTAMSKEHEGYVW